MVVRYIYGHFKPMSSIYCYSTPTLSFNFKMRSETTSGKPCQIFWNNKFALGHQGVVLTTWNCTIRGCKAAIHTNQYDVIQEDFVVHNHPDKVSNLPAHQLKVTCKRKGLSDIDTPPSKVIRKELQGQGEDSSLVTMSDITSCKSALWRSRVKSYDKLPKSASETVEKVKKSQCQPHAKKISWCFCPSTCNYLLHLFKLSLNYCFHILLIVQVLYLLFH